MEKVPFDLLDTLLAVRESQSLEQAARRLGTTQPTVSRRLAELQRLLSVPLFAESGRRKVLSRMALELCDDVGRSFNYLNRRMKHWEALYREPKNVVFRVGGRVELLARLMNSAPAVPALEAVELHTPDVVRALINLDIELGVTYDLPPRSEFVARKLLEEKMFVVCSTKLLRKSRPPLERVIREIPALTYRRDLPQLLEFLSYYDCDASELHYSHSLNDWRSLIELAHRGMGWVLVPGRFRQFCGGLEVYEPKQKAFGETTFYLVARKELFKIDWFNDWFRALLIS